MRINLQSIIIAGLFVCFAQFGLAQKIKLTLDQAIGEAQKESLDIFRSRNMYRVKELNHQDFLVELRPHLNLQLTPLDYNRSIVEEYNSELMKYEPVEIQRLTSQYNLGINQKIGLTGGNLLVNSSLMRSQRFGGSGSSNNLDFISTPLSIGYQQNFSRINDYKWKAKIEPLRFEQAKLEFIEQREDVSVKAVNLFFSVLVAQMNFDIAVLNSQNADSLISMGHKREQIGTISRDDLLNLELKQVNAGISVEQAKNQLENARLDFCDFLELPHNTEIECITPEKVELAFINPQQAQQLAEKNNPDSHGLVQKLLEAQKQVSVYKRSKYDVSLEAGIGLNQNKEVFSEAFHDLLDRQNFRIAVNIPILNWSETKRNIQRASLNEQITQRENEKIKDQLMIEVAKKVNEFNIKRSELNSAAKADTISRHAYELTQQLFAMGKANVISINESYKAMYSAQNQYLNALRNYWFYYYTIRKLCLFDFEAGIELTKDFEHILETKF